MTLRTGCERGFLLIEAALTSVVLTVGAVSMSRGLGQMLHTLARLQQQEDLMMAAVEVLRTLEVEALADGRIRRLAGTAGSGDHGYQWMLRHEPVLTAWSVQEAWHRVELTVSRRDAPRVQTRLATCWPRTWVDE